ncbi:MAG TPA: pentapeptide repeat-containing protein [Nitrospiraceae bacterium]|nr:pentapeptide repeat-containing protein [Nitrospiraceae bacterium]
MNHWSKLLSCCRRPSRLSRSKILAQANLQSARLSGADLTGAQLDKADLRRATLDGTDLSLVSGLTQAQLDTACVDEQTKLPPDLSRPAPCMKAEKKKGR